MQPGKLIIFSAPSGSGKSTPTAATMERDYILENIQSKGNYELYIPPNVKHHGYFPKGHKPWNASYTGLSRW